MEAKKREEALQRAMVLCSRSEKCRKDIIDRLEGWGINNPADKEYVISELTRQKFIDEKRYARSYTLEKHRLNHWGFIKIGMMLRSKGIDAGTIEMAHKEIDPDDYRKVLTDELLKKKSTIKASNQYDLKGKLMRYALSKGFETDLVYRVIAEITGN